MGREEQHHGCENSRDSGSDSKFAMERGEERRGGAGRERLVGCTNFLVHCTVKLAEYAEWCWGRNGIEEERAIEYV